MIRIDVFITDGVYSEWESTSQRQCIAKLAALSSSPNTLQEWHYSLATYDSGHACRAANRFGSNEPSTSNAFGISKRALWIDLAARLIVMKGCGFALSHEDELLEGFVELTDANGVQVEVPFHLGSDWQCVEISHGEGEHQFWQSLAWRRAIVRKSNPKIDYRQILYGRPFLEYVVDEWLQIPWTAADHIDYETLESTIRDMHQRWLWLPREEWRGLSAREMMLEQHAHRIHDLEDRADFWSAMGQPPTPLSMESTSIELKVLARMREFSTTILCGIC